MTNHEKLLAVLKILNDPDWAFMSSNAIAKHIGVSAPFVRKIRKSIPQGENK